MSVVLPVRQVEKPWGRDRLPPPFTVPAGQRIGEIWFEPPPELSSLLVKYIFTSENLSVQTHPSDAQTQRAGLGHQGKEECWYVIDAEPGARLGVGFSRDLDADAMRRAAIDGSIEKLLTWHPVRRGDFFYIPANTVHAIGAGIGLIEVQQNSDVTFRLYDYGRPRELHLDEGVAVAVGAAHDAALRRHVDENASVRLVDGPYFLLDRVHGTPAAAMSDDYDRPTLAIPLDGAITVSGEQVMPGQCALAPTIAEIEFSGAGSCLLTAPC